MVIRPNIERLLDGHAPLREWRFAPDAAGRFDGVVDVFGDGSVWALWVPGHTPGSTAYLVSTARARCSSRAMPRTRAGAGSTTSSPAPTPLDPEQSAASFRRLRAFATAHPNIEVRVGHQR